MEKINNIFSYSDLFQIQRLLDTTVHECEKLKTTMIRLQDLVFYEMFKCQSPKKILHGHKNVKKKIHYKRK